MEENNKVEIQEESKQEALLEPIPYKREVTEDTATVSEDTSSEEEATPDREHPVNAEEKVFKKRYDDLKRHYDSTVNKHKDEVSRFKTQLEESTEKIQLPKTKEEIDAWRAKYPDVYDVIETIAHTKADEKAKQVQTKLKDLETAQANVTKEKAEVKLSQLHPDFNDIKESDDFHNWADEQPMEIKSWIYENNNNGKLAARAVDLYKKDRGLGLDKKTTTERKQPNVGADLLVKTKEQIGQPTGGQQTFNVSDIKNMSDAEFEQYEKDIVTAQREGRLFNK